MNSTEPLRSSGKKYLVAVRPLSFEAKVVREKISGCGKDYFLDTMTLTERLTGFGPRVLYQSRDREKISLAARDAKRLGADVAIIDFDHVTEEGRPLLIREIKESGGNLNLIESKGKLHPLSSRGKCLIVLGCKEPENLLRKRVARMSQMNVSVLTFDEILKICLRHTPVVDFYLPSSSIPFRIEGDRFNFNSLGEGKTLTMSGNMEALFSKIMNYFDDPLIDTSFGESDTPFAPPLSECRGDEVMSFFSAHSRLVHLCVEKGMYTESDKAGKKCMEITPFSGREVAWISPSNLTDKSGDYVKGKGDIHLLEDTTGQLPPPPVTPWSSRRTFFGLSFLFDLYTRLFLFKGARLPLPRIIYYPLSLGFAGGLIAAHLTREPLFLASALITGSLLFFALSFALFSLKRDVENVPVAKVRSMAMGLVELIGRTGQIYSLKAPFSGTECVHYSYAVFENRGIGRAKGARLVEEGDSGPVPFTLEDGTGKVMVDPEGAYLEGGVKQSFRDLDNSSPVGGLSRLRDDSWVVEKVIPPGHRITLLGCAQPGITASMEREKRVKEKLGEIKRDKEKLHEFDLDGDGHVDGSEWDMGREKVSREIFLKGEKKEGNPFVSAPPGGGVFYIGDGNEKSVTRGMGLKAAMFFILSILSLSGGIILLMKTI